MQKLTRLFVVAFISSMLVSLGMAQTITGAITGTVTDSSGGIVANVRVTAANTGTNLTSPTQTNEAGVYNLLFLPVGNYTVTVEAAGFKRSVLGPFALEVAQVARVDIKLEVGEVTQSVQITDVAPILQTETTQTGDVIAGTAATALPINSRNVVQLTLLVPGVVTPNPTGMVTFRGGARPYVNGNREQTNNFLLDGMDVNESVGNAVSYNPNVDALEEVKISTGNAPAEFGNANGAIVNMTTKSGTNQFHGNAFEFLRNEKFDANSFFNNRSGAKKRALRQNIFGGTVGGPIRKDKAFFFADYQGARQIDSGPALRSVALPDYRIGNLSRFSASIKDPTLSGACSASVKTACFPGNIIPQNRIVNPAAQALFSNATLYPLPNVTGTGAIGVTNNYLSASRNTIQSDQMDAKVDYRLTEKDNLSGRLTIARYGSVSGSAVPFQMGSVSNQPTTGAVINWTRSFSPSIVNEGRIGYHRTFSTSDTTDPFGVLGSSGNAKLGIAGGQPIAGSSSVALGDGMTSIGAGASDSATVDNTFQYGDNLTYQRGRHTMKMGFQFLRYQQNRFYAGNNGLLGIFTFNGTYTTDAYADFLLNLLNIKGRGSQAGKWGHRQWRDGIFFQDDFKLRPNVTLNLGLRWEYTQPVYEVKDRQANFNLQTGVEQLAGKDGNSRAGYKPYYKQFMPRVGVAWTPSMFHNKLVVRSGYGITSFMEGTGANLRLPLNPPFFFESNIQYDASTPGDIRTGFADAVPLNTASGQVRAWDPNLRPAFIQQWNVSLEYEVMASTSWNVAYVGQKGTHVVDPREFNQPLPGVGPVASWAPLQTRRPLYAFAPLITTISGTDSSSTMFYNGLQTGVRRRFSHGLEFLVSYTYSKTLTDNLGYYGSSGVVAEGAYFQNAYDRHGDWGRAFFDAAHVFSVGGYYDLPVGRNRAFGKSWGRAADLALGGWTANYAVSLHSGFPVTLSSTGQAGGQLARGTLRPNRYKSGLTYASQSIDNWFGSGNTFCLTAGVNDGSCAYGVPATEAFGNASKGSEQAPAYRDLDLSIGKKFNVTERKYFDFRAEFFNILNHPSFSPPSSNIAAPATFGFITGTISNPRNVEFALKFYF